MPPSIKSAEFFSLCFLTVIRNRRHHLEITLPANLAANANAATKFLILDYGSTDGLKTYLFSHFRDEIRSGRISYHRFSGVQFFHRSHSRNVAASLCNAAYLCNLDADNFTGKDFDLFLKAMFATDPDAVITGLGNDLQILGAFGRVAVKASHFHSVGGYDESFDGYGFEDYDLISRIERSGRKKIIINDPAFLQVLAHEDAERSGEESAAHLLQSLYRQQVSASLQVLLYLFKDGSFAYGLLHENLTSAVHYRYQLAGDDWQRGTWVEDASGLSLTFDSFEAHFSKEGDRFLGNQHLLIKETRPAELQEAIIFLTNISNRGRYLRNIQTGTITVNKSPQPISPLKSTYTHG